MIDKNKLLNQLKSLVEERMKISFDAMQEAQNSANEESKSSAGDKYETGRAMAQIERDRYAQQYELARKERVSLEKINEKQVFTQLGVGAIAETSMGIIFIAISLGMVAYENQKIMVISAQSPIGMVLIGKKTADVFDFRGRQHTISRIL